MYFRKASKSVALFLVTGFLIILTVSSCTIAETVTGITPTPITPSPTPRVCPSDVDISSLDGLDIKPTFIVVLFDANSVTNESLEYSNGEKTADVMRFVGSLLPKLLGPGDQYSIFSLGFRNYEAAKLDRYNSKITEAPEIIATPQIQDTLTPIPTPTLSSAVLANQAARNQYEADVEAQNATATQSAFEYDCEVAAYDASYKVTATAWSVTKQAEANEIATQIVVARNDREERIETLETPFAPDNVYEGLSHVTVDFEDQCKKYERCILIVFDNLGDWRIETPDYLHVNLEGVEVISILPQCGDIIEPNCKRIQNLWTPQFLYLRAKSVEYYNGENLEASLLGYFGGK